MDPRTTLAKTAKGREEIEQRRYKLAGRLRALLIIVDGLRSIEDLASDGKKLGVPDDALNVLMREGFVAPVAGTAQTVAPPVAGTVAAVPAVAAPPADEFTRFRTAQQFMNDTAVDNMSGLKRFTFTRKLERCSGRQDLAELIPDYEQALTRSIGNDAAAVLVTQLRDILG